MQTPAYYDQIVGDFILRPAKDGERAIAVEPQVQVAALPVQPTPPIVIDNGNAPIASFMRHNGGWSIAFSIADPTLAISWRLGESGEFKETGFTDALDPRTRRRMPNPSQPPFDFVSFPGHPVRFRLRHISTSGDPFRPRFDFVSIPGEPFRPRLDPVSASLDPL